MFRQFCPEKTLSTLETWAYFWNCPEGAACYNTRLQKWLQTFSRTFPAKSPDNVQVSSCDTTAGNTHRTINHVQPCAAPWTWTALTVHSPTPVTPPPTPPTPLFLSCGLQSLENFSQVFHVREQFLLALRLLCDWSRVHTALTQCPLGSAPWHSQDGEVKLRVFTVGIWRTECY